MFNKSSKVKNVVVTLMCLVVASCANTRLKETWMLEDHKKTYHQPMIIGISDSQQTRRIYENHFVSELKKKNIDAVPSYTLISSKQVINRETVVAAIKDTDIDAVLVSYLVSADEEIRHQNSPLNMSYSGSVESSQISATIVTTRGRSRTGEVFVLKNDIYDAESNELVWSAYTKTVAPESIDEVVTDVTELLIGELFADELLK